MKKAKSKKKVKKKTAKRASAAPKKKTEKPIGEVVHYFTNIKVAVVKFKAPVKSGTRVKFEGATTSFSQVLGSMQFNHAPVTRVAKGKAVGVKVSKRVREGDKVYKAE